MLGMQIWGPIPYLGVQQELWFFSSKCWLNNERNILWWV